MIITALSLFCGVLAKVYLYELLNVVMLLVIPSSPGVLDASAEYLCEGIVCRSVDSCSFYYSATGYAGGFFAHPKASMILLYLNF